MTTQWTSPTVVEQYVEDGAEAVHVAWKETELTGNTVITTDGTLLHLARSPKVDYKNKTYYLKATGFNFTNVPENISGVELRLNTDRRGRVSDETIQLLVNNAPVGDNQATLVLDPIKHYGGENSIWGLDSLSKEEILNSGFGVLIRFKAHPDWPHRDEAKIRAVQLLIY